MDNNIYIQDDPLDDKKLAQKLSGEDATLSISRKIRYGFSLNGYHNLSKTDFLRYITFYKSIVNRPFKWCKYSCFYEGQLNRTYFSLFIDVGFEPILNTKIIYRKW